MLPLTNPPLPLATILATPEFWKLTPSQQTWVTRFVSKGHTTGIFDAEDAVMMAYGKDTEHLKLRAYQMLHKKRIQKVLYGVGNLELILSDLQRAAKKSVKLGMGLTPRTVTALAAFEKYVTEKSNG